MTDEELKSLATDFVAGFGCLARGSYPDALVGMRANAGLRLAQGYLALSARLAALEAERGEIVKACPHCNSFEIEFTERNGGSTKCLTCWHRFNEPAYWQRVTKGSAHENI